ncbi:MAG: hypothetical protein GEU90_07810 [Gemmatimonas sp.]|nr:hypothetical protein [Gemmatimonas sp.]
MATNRTIDETNDARLNELYWYTGRTIEEIVRELGVNRNTLYASIRPLPSGMTCTTCGAAVVFANRTKRSSGIGLCEGCSIETVFLAELDSDAPAPLDAPAPDNQRRWERWREELVAVPPERAALIGGAAALGAIFGTVAVKAARR